MVLAGLPQKDFTKGVGELWQIILTSSSRKISMFIVEYFFLLIFESGFKLVVNIF